jgi:hypothetical protein
MKSSHETMIFGSVAKKDIRKPVALECAAILRLPQSNFRPDEAAWPGCVTEANTGPVQQKELKS